jgi:3-deoxy-D-manno-octulosonate 8-phosphate phosphatase (KDO 8-P phosphatase)
MKLPAYEELKEATGFSDEQIAYVGDDVVDLPVMTRVGLAIAVQDAHYLAKQHAHWVTPSGGGRGAGREVCELIMDAQGRLHDSLQSYLN